MNFLKCSLAAALPIALLAFIPTRAQESNNPSAGSIPGIISFAGELKSQDGKPATGVIDIAFLLFEDEEGGTPLWQENQRVTVDAGGHFSVALGARTDGGVPLELFASKKARWLEVEPEGLPAPARVALLSVPYAAKAGDAETVGGLPPSAFLRANALPREGFAPAAPFSAVHATAPGGGGTAGFVPLWTPNGTTLGNSVLSQTGSAGTARIGIYNSAPAATLDISGDELVRGSLQLTPLARATRTKGSNSQPFILQASAFSSSTAVATFPTFQWQAEPVANNSAAPGATMNLLYGPRAAPAETGLSIASNGRITFARGQSFPGTGAGTITGVAAGSGLSGGGNNGSVTLGIDTTKVPLLKAANTFTGDQSVLGNLSASNLHVTGTTNFTGLVTFAGTMVGIGTTAPAATLDVHGNANFTGPVTFAAGQSFPGAGTITGVTAGAGLTGGGGSGALTLKLDTAYSDSRYAQLGSNNTFTGTQIINNAVGIGVSPSYPLHVNGTIRAETGLSLGGNAALAVDAPGIIGGHFLVAANGKVGINNPNPSSALDVVGNIGASGTLIGGSLNVSGSVRIGSDTAMSAAPHMTLSAYIPSPISAGVVVRPIFMIPTRDILITRMTSNGWNPCTGSGAETFTLYTGGQLGVALTSHYTLTLTGSFPTINDSGALSISVAAGTPLWVISNATPGCPIGSNSPGDIAISVEYLMQ